jgi:hypothetical protein
VLHGLRRNGELRNYPHEVHAELCRELSNCYVRACGQTEAASELQSAMSCASIVPMAAASFIHAG